MRYPQAFCRGGQFLHFAFFLRVRLVQHDRIERAEFADPGGAGERAACVDISGLPALSDARRAEGSAYMADVIAIGVCSRR